MSKDTLLVKDLIPIGGKVFDFQIRESILAGKPTLWVFIHGFNGFSFYPVCSVAEGYRSIDMIVAEVQRRGWSSVDYHILGDIYYYLRGKSNQENSIEKCEK